MGAGEAGAGATRGSRNSFSVGTRAPTRAWAPGMLCFPLEIIFLALRIKRSRCSCWIVDFHLPPVSNPAANCPCTPGRPSGMKHHVQKGATSKNPNQTVFQPPKSQQQNRDTNPSSPKGKSIETVSPILSQPHTSAWSCDLSFLV